MNFDYLVFLVFAGVVAFVFHQLATKGLKGLLFGGKIDKTYGEVTLEKRGMLAGKIKVHKVVSKRGDRVGIELVNRTALSYQLVPATLSKDEARRLIQLLTQATNDA